MRALRVLLMTMLTVVLLGATAYGAGMAVRTWESGPSPDATPSRPAASPSQSPTEPADPQTPTDPQTPIAPKWLLKQGDRGKQVRELQHRLFQLSWLPEATTGAFDIDTVAAVKGFQVKRGLEATGKVDQRTWDRLSRMTSTPTEDQLFNRWHPGPALLAAGDTGSDVRAAQARLQQLDWYFGDVTGTYDDHTVEAVRGFQEKRGIPVTGEIDQRTMDRLVGMTTTPTYDEMHNIEPQPGALDPRCKVGRVLCVDKTTSTLRWVVDGKVVKTMDARFGSVVNNTPTREGEFRVYYKNRDHVSRLYGSAMPFAMFFDGGQAVHYSSDFAAVGYNGASHGCVNIRDYDGIAWLFDQVVVGDKVVVYWS